MPPCSHPLWRGVQPRAYVNYMMPLSDALTKVSMPLIARLNFGIRWATRIIYFNGIVNPSVNCSWRVLRSRACYRGPPRCSSPTSCVEFDEVPSIPGCKSRFLGSIQVDTLIICCVPRWNSEISPIWSVSSRNIARSSASIISWFNVFSLTCRWKALWRILVNDESTCQTALLVCLFLG